MYLFYGLLTASGRNFMDMKIFMRETPVEIVLRNLPQDISLIDIQGILGKIRPVSIEFAATDSGTVFIKVSHQFEADFLVKEGFTFRDKKIRV